MSFSDFIKKVFNTEAALKFEWSMGLYRSHIPEMLLAQKLTKRNHPVKKYSSIEEISHDSAKIQWTSDPFGGRFDLLRHPCYMQEAIDSHPDTAGDCEDYTAWWMRALYKARDKDNIPLIRTAYMGVVYWKNANGGAQVGHAVCVYQTTDMKWHWSGNWNKSVPYNIDHELDWINGVVRGGTLVVAGKIELDKFLEDDTFVPGRAIRLA